MGTKGFAFLVGTVAAGALLSGCSTPPKPGHGQTAHDQVYPLERSADREEVDRRFDEAYPGALNWGWVWFRDRWFDLWDIPSWDIQFGRGFGVNVTATEYAQAGIGWWDGMSLGERGRSWGMWDEHVVHRGLGPFYWVEIERTPKWGTKNLFDHEYKYTGWDLFEESGNKAAHHDWADLGAGANVLAVGASVAASPVEAVDFIAGLIPIQLVTGWFGAHQPVFDIKSDDTYNRMAHELAEEKGLGR